MKVLPKVAWEPIRRPSVKGVRKRVLIDTNLGGTTEFTLRPIVDDAFFVFLGYFAVVPHHEQGGILMTGAQALIEGLKRENVTQIFGHAGATLCPIADCLMNADICFTLVRFEQGAGHMASGYARASGKVGVCMGRRRTGDTNLITGIATAYMDNIPMVAVTGQVPSSHLGHDVFQEFDITTAAAPFVKHSYLVKDAGEIPRIVKEAFYIASTGRPGPVLIDLPIDVQNQELDFAWLRRSACGAISPSSGRTIFRSKRWGRPSGKRNGL
jgi:acetolactate synthase-1/2/3 large subunit